MPRTVAAKDHQLESINYELLLFLRLAKKLHSPQQQRHAGVLKSKLPMVASRYFSLLAAFFVSTALLFATHSATKPKQEAAKPGPVHFEDIARQAGLNAVNVYGGATHKEFIIENTGNAEMILESGNEGWPDIFLLNGSTENGFAASKTPTGHL